MYRAFEFIERVYKLPSADAVMDEVGAALRRHYGIENYIFSFIALPTETLADVTVANGLPLGLAEAYDRLDLVHHDPGFRHAQITVHPFRWFKEAPYDPEAEPRAQETVNFFRDYGLVDGIVLPLATRARRLGQIWFGGRSLDVPKRDELALHLTASYAFDRVMQIKGDASTHVSLTTRERDALTLVAVGKTTQQIADTINLSRSAVLKHLNNSRCKLGAVNLPHAVAIAMRQRMILP